VWCEEVDEKRQKDLLEPIVTCEETKEEMHAHYVPPHYKHHLSIKITKLTQSFKFNEECYKEMHIAMMRDNIQERGDKLWKCS
jgi:hypothetical protein